MNFIKKLSALILVFMLVFSTLVIPAVAEGPFTITFTQPTGAVVSFSPAGVDSFVEGVHTYTFQNGDQVEMTVTAESGYVLTSILANGFPLSGVNGKHSLVYSEKISSNTTLVITTTPQQTAALAVNDSNFTYTFEGDTVENNITAVVGSNATLKITPNEGFTVTKILYNGAEVTPGNEYAFTVGEANNFEVFVEGAPTVALTTVIVSGEGSVTPESGSFPIGTPVELTFSAGASYTLATVAINDVPLSLDQILGNKYTLIINADTVVKVEYKKSYTLTVMAGTGGTISINGESVNGTSTKKVAEGNAVIITVNAGLGYKISSVKIDNTSVTLDAENRYTIASVTAGVKIQATFEATTETQYNIKATADANGIISPSGNSNTVEPGKSKTFNILPNTGFEVDTVLVDGQAVSITNNAYTFEGVISDHTIHVTFKATTTSTAPITVDDVDWTTTGTIIIDISKQKKVATEVLQRITSDCKDKKVVFQADTFKWTLPQGASISTSLASADLDVIFNGGNNFNRITSLIKLKIEDIDFTLVTYGKYISFPAGTELSVFLGNDYKNKEVQELLYNSSDNSLVSPNNASGTPEVTVLTASPDGWVTVLYNNDSDIILSEKLDGNYKIVATASAGGTINQLGNIFVETGGEAIFEIKANEGYVISSLKVDNVEVNDALGQTSYTYSAFKNISQDHTITASFLLQADYEASVENGGGNSALIVSLIIVFLALAGAATLFIIKWRQERY